MNRGMSRENIVENNGENNEENNGQNNMENKGQNNMMENEQDEIELLDNANQAINEQ